MATALTLMKLWKVAANPKRKSRCPGVMHLSAAGQTPFPPLSGLLCLTFSVLTAADQNNTYLFMHASRNHMWAKKVYISWKKKTQDRHHPGIVTLSFWAMCNHLRVACCNWIVFVSFNMQNSLRRMRVERQDIDWWASNYAINHLNIIQFLTLDICIYTLMCHLTSYFGLFTFVLLDWFFVQSCDLRGVYIHVAIIYIMSFMCINYSAVCWNQRR